jgi:O-antigen/teichoic acid export membrane protein
MSFLLSEQASVYRPAGVLVLARVANVGVGLVTIPVLIHFLGGDGFAAWAIMLAISAAFTALEIGMAPTFVKYAAPLMQQGRWHDSAALRSSAQGLLACVFMLGALVLVPLAPWAARRLQIPDTPSMDAGALVVLAYAAVALRSLLQFGVHTLAAARRFNALAVASFVQSMASNLAAAVAAIASRRLDIALIAFWGTQLLVVGATFAVSRRLSGGSRVLTMPSRASLRELLPHGLKVQACDWAQIVTFQFDKFLIAGLIGLSGVAPYEVANRSLMALRSVPGSGLDSFLPSASIGQAAPDKVWERYLRVTRLAAIAVIVFMLAPLAIAPMFLYAWTGQMGYLSRGVFAGLSAGFAVSVLALPAAAMAQAAGRADIQARSAVATMLVNVPLSFLLLSRWGATGAAVGTSIAMIVGAAVLLRGMHRAYGRPIAPTLAMLRRFWPALLVCAAAAALVYLPFDTWMESVAPRQRYAWRTRVGPGLLSVFGYAVVVATIAWWQFRRDAPTREQRERLAAWLSAFRATPRGASDHRPGEGRDRRAPGWRDDG